MWGRGSVSSATRCLNVRRWCGQRTRLGLGCHGSSIRPSRSVVLYIVVRGAVVVGHPLEAERRGREWETGPEIGLADGQTDGAFRMMDVLRCCVLLCPNHRRQTASFEIATMRATLGRATQRSKQSSGRCCACCAVLPAKYLPADRSLPAFARCCARSAACLQQQQTRDGCLLFEPNLVFCRA